MSERRRDPRETISSFVEKAYMALARTDYYGILGVGRDATAQELRDSYYRLASRLHPDLHGEWMSPPLRDKLTSVFSRVVEAYKVLTHGERRVEYDAGLAEGHMRFDADAAARPKIKRAEDDVPDGSARKFFKLGCAALQASNAKGAIMNFKMAMSMAPGNQVIRGELDKAEALLERQVGGG